MKIKNKRKKLDFYAVIGMISVLQEKGLETGLDLGQVTELARVALRVNAEQSEDKHMEEARVMLQELYIRIVGEGK